MPKKEWNEEAQRWEIDGEPVTYWVSWTDTDGTHHEKEFKDIDAGHDYYLHKQNWASHYGYRDVKWEHRPY